MSVPGYLDTNPSASRDIKASVDYLRTLQDSEGNFPCALDELNRQVNELVHWCHGAPGMIYLMAKAYLLWHEPKYLKSCKDMSDLIWIKGLLKKGPGICHGVAGNGYASLLMYRMTEEQMYLARAGVFAKFLKADVFKREARVPDYPYSLYEGIAGTACFLADLIEPAKAAFPFSDIF